MPPSPRAQKGYMYIGMAVWFILRWVFYIGLYIMAFVMGGMDGPISERIRNFPWPKIQIKEWPPGRSRISTSGFRVPYYTVLTGSFRNPQDASALQGRLASIRTPSHVVIQNDRYYVCVGKLGSVGEANTILQKLRNKGVLDAVVISPYE